MVERTEERPIGEAVPAEQLRDKVDPAGRWEFNAEVAAVFENMLERSIPQHQTMRAAVNALAMRHAQQGTDVVDLGASRGDAVAPLVDHFGARARFQLVEVSEPMLAVLRERFKGYADCGVVNVRAMDLRRDFPRCKASVILAVLTIQFTPIEHRLRILRAAHDALLPGGAMIMVEKVLGSTAAMDDLFVSLYHGAKKDAGYTQDQIDRKALALEGVLVPVTAPMNEDFLRAAGFREVETFWRWMNFCGWIAVKE